MSTWINGRPAAGLDVLDRGLQYGDGLFETMLVCNGRIRLLDLHLDRLQEGCQRLKIKAPARRAVTAELLRIAALRSHAILKLIVTRGAGPRGYRPSGLERPTRIVTLSPAGEGGLAASAPVRVRICATPLGANPCLAGLKSLNRLESVMARAEWSDARIWEGLMLDVDGHVVCGTMSNVFLRRGSVLMTPKLDQCGVAGVMRRWILSQAPTLQLRPAERRIRWRDLAAAEEVFLSNAVIGLRSVRRIERSARLPGDTATSIRYRRFPVANSLRKLLAAL